MSNFVESDYLALYPDVAEAVNKGFIKSGYEHFKKHGEAEGRLPSIFSEVTTREIAVFQLIDKNGLGLEIGPSHNPIAPKKKGYKVHVLDHASADDLRTKYKDHGLNLENIEEVDFIWKGQPLTELIGNRNCYDWIIASHVVEHVPDLVSFLQQCEELLKPSGVLSLVIPDKRYCFDHFQPLSTTGLLLDAHFYKRSRPSPGQVFDNIANASNFNGNIAWSRNHGHANNLNHTLYDAKVNYENSLLRDEYIDVHCWRFTPESFKLIISDLLELGLLRLEPKISYPTNGCEFYVTLGGLTTEKAIRLENRLENLMQIAATQTVEDKRASQASFYGHLKITWKYKLRSIIKRIKASIYGVKERMIGIFK